MASTGKVVTYKELDDAANRLSNLLRSAGLEVGDHVAICMENHERYMEVIWGCHYAGLIYTACSSRLTSDELTYIINDCGAKAFITSKYKADQAAAVHFIGATSVIMEHFDAEEYLKLIERYKVTHSQLVPTMFVRMLKLPADVRKRYDTSSLQCAIHAAAPCPVEVKRQMIEWWGPVIHEYYAGTEGNGFVYCNSEMWLSHPGTVGKAIQGVVHICDENGDEVPSGESGTVFFDSGTVFEYHNDPEKTKSSRDPKGRGWSTLGDVGYLDADGFLYLTDRKAFMIISGGVNIYPQESENVLINHPKVVDVAVFGVPNDEFGEEVKAVVQPVTMPASDDEARTLERELIAFCRSQLADLKCPRSVDFRPDLPRHPTGKLYKRLLKDEYWKAAGRSI
ncbi:MAG: hypothetical protein EBV24_10100 [Actinobacteria bacterium]|nr:hypothetical protein [Actinomycetota bacterium]